jgi:hypothetical protein
VSNIHSWYSFSNTKSARSLLSKYKAAVKGRDSSKVAFEELNASVDEAQLQKWREEESMAMESRGEYLRIYDVRTEKGKFNFFSELALDFGLFQLPL